MKLTLSGEEYADSLFFKNGRIIHEATQAALKKEKFVNHETTAQTDYSLRIEAAAKMGAARMQSYVDAYELESEQVEHDDVIEFIQAAKKIIERQASQLISCSQGTITMVRNQWSPEYRDRMLQYFQDKAFNMMESEMNEIILKSKEAPLKKALRRKMTKRNKVFRWIVGNAECRQHTPVDLYGFLNVDSESSEKELEGISEFLAGEGLVDQINDNGLLVSLTHKGVKAGEANEDIGATTLAPTTVQHTQNTFHAPVGAVQQGDGNTANVAQKIGPDIAGVANLLQQLRENLSPEHKEEGSEYIAALEDELGKPKPKESRLRLFLKGAGGFATEAGKAVVGELAKKLLSGEISL